MGPTPRNRPPRSPAVHHRPGRQSQGGAATNDHGQRQRRDHTTPLRGRVGRLNGFVLLGRRRNPSDPKVTSTECVRAVGRPARSAGISLTTHAEGRVRSAGPGPLAITRSSPKPHSHPVDISDNLAPLDCKSAHPPGLRLLGSMAAPRSVRTGSCPHRPANRAQRSDPANTSTSLLHRHAAYCLCWIVVVGAVVHLVTRLPAVSPEDSARTHFFRPWQPPVLYVVSRVLHLIRLRGKRFSRCAAAAACRRFDTPNFAMMWETWTLTVLSVMNSRLAICWFE